MLVSTIITNGQLLADVPNTNFFTEAEALFAVQASWKDIYSMLCDGGDDYFSTPIYFTSSSFSTDSNRQDMYYFPINTIAVITNNDFYRLRLLQYQGMNGNIYFSATRMTIENFGNTQNTPAYRMVGQRIYVYDPSHYSNWCLWYYPAPATLSTSTDLSYPYSMIPEIMAYQVAIEIRRKQNLDFSQKEDRRNELIVSMNHQMNRDEAKAESIKNVFTQGFAPYI